MRRIRHAAVGLLVATVVAACTTTTSGTGSLARGAASGGSSTPGGRDLQAQLLTVADLPAGWAVDNSDNSSNATAPPCLRAASAGGRALQQAQVDFVQGTDFPAFQEELGYFGSKSAAALRLAVTTGVLDKCTDVSFDSGGHHFTASMGRLSFPQLGDRSAAWQIVLTAEGLTAGVDVIFVQRGAELAFLLYADLGTPGLTGVVAIARKAVARMPAS